MSHKEFNTKRETLKTKGDIQDTYSQIAKVCSLKDEVRGVNSLTVSPNGVLSKEATLKARETEAKRVGLVKYIENNKGNKAYFNGVFDKEDSDQFGLPIFKYLPHCILIIYPQGFN